MNSGESMNSGYNRRNSGYNRRNNNCTYAKLFIIIPYILSFISTLYRSYYNNNCTGATGYIISNVIYIILLTALAMVSWPCNKLFLPAMLFLAFIVWLIQVWYYWECMYTIVDINSDFDDDNKEVGVGDKCGGAVENPPICNDGLVCVMDSSNKVGSSGTCQLPDKK